MENGTFIILVLYVDDMIVERKRMIEINNLKAQLDSTCDMKDIGVEKQILGMEIHRDKKNGKLSLSQQKHVEKILMIFGMNDVYHMLMQ